MGEWALIGILRIILRAVATHICHCPYPSSTNHMLNLAASGLLNILSGTCKDMADFTSFFLFLGMSILKN